MKRKLFLLSLLMLIGIFYAEFLDIPVTRDPNSNGNYGDLEKYNSEHPQVPAQIREISRSFSTNREDESILIIVEESLYDQIEYSLNTYISDLESENSSVFLLLFSGNSALDLKFQIQLYYQEEDLTGAVLIGDLPFGIFEMFEDFNNNGIWDPDESWVSFPCDLYYTDIDGIWEDNDNNGAFEVHEGDVHPEIFIGRIKTENLSFLQQTEAELINSYFSRNHLYRMGMINFPSTALAYIDDDWEAGAEDYQQALQLLYPNTTLVSNINETTADDYREFRLHQNYEFIQVHVHSGPEAHHFYENNGTGAGLVTNSEIAVVQPDALFYNLFACSNSRYTIENNMGGMYIYGNESCFATIGSTKTGAMLFFEDFYQPLADDENLGEAMRLWWEQNVDASEDWMWERSWFYGMIVQGDPTLKLQYNYDTVFFVPADYPSIQDAIDASADGDIIIVASGTYLENINFDGKNITIASEFLTTQDTTFISQTIIDGNQTESVVTFGNVETNNASLIGFTITNGQSDFYGAGISCINASPTLSNLKVVNNHFSSWGIGGGINFLNSSAVLENIELINNSAQFGGAIHAEDSQLEMTNITFISNEAFWGGGICMLNAEADISNALFHNNYSPNEGGAIWTDRSDLNLINATLVGNSAISYGGGIYLIWSSYINLVNCVFQENYPEDICFTYDGYYPYSTMNIAYCNFADGETGIVTNTNGYLNMLEGNSYLDPEFESSEDFHLQDSSPCIGTGIDQVLIAGTYYQAPEFDLDENPRPAPNGSMPDIGGFENPLGNPQVGINNNKLPMPNIHLSNYPNPFNPSTEISFQISEFNREESIELIIYNLKGQKVRSFLIVSPTDQTNNSITWNGTDELGKHVSSGVYFYKLKSGDFEKTKKMLLMK